MRRLLLIFITLGSALISQSQTLPVTTPTAQWGCPSIPFNSRFDTTCFRKTGEIKLGQAYFDVFGTADPIYAIIPKDRPSYAITIAICWSYFRNVVGNDAMNINTLIAQGVQEGGWATYPNAGGALPATIYNLNSGTTTNLAPNVLYTRGGSTTPQTLATYNTNVSTNGWEGPFQFGTPGYETVAPYIPTRFPGPATAMCTFYNKVFESAAMEKMFYDLSLYRRTQLMNGVDLGALETADQYGTEAALANCYNLGLNSAVCASCLGWTAPAGMATNPYWASSYFPNGAGQEYAQRTACLTAVLNNDEAYARAHYTGPYGTGGNVNNWHFYDWYNSQIRWDSVAGCVNRLLTMMYPTVNRTAFLATIKPSFDAMDTNLDGMLSFRYEMGPVIDAIVKNLPKEDPGFNAEYAVNASGCKYGCSAPYATIKPQGPTDICANQQVQLVADIDSPTNTTTLQWFRNGVAVAAGLGGTNDTIVVNYADAGTYTMVVCWKTNKQTTPFAATTCCATPQCSVTITQRTGCSTCAMNYTPTITPNACTSMTNGSVSVAVTGNPGGNLIYSWTGPVSGSVTTSANPYVITGLRDGRYTITVTNQTTPSCRMIKDVVITPTTVIREQLTATANNGACPVQLQASLSNQRPASCNVQVSYGAMDYNWDPAYFQELRVNGSTYMTMWEGYSSSSLPGNQNTPWNAYPWNFPAVGTGNAPRVATISVYDGDTISLYGSMVVPLGTAMGTYYDAATEIEGTGVTFTQVATTTTQSSVFFRYRGTPVAAPSPVINPAIGTRQIQNSWVVTCPVVNPPVYTYSWSPTTGMPNPNIANPVVGIVTPPSVVYTVTATHPNNPACQLTATATVTRSCTPLPVDLIYFDATYSTGVVHLEWTTVNERDCKTYYIERSKDGISFERISSVACLNTSGIHEYTSTDEYPYSGVSWYRIAAEDIDGSLSYSLIKAVNVNTATAFIYPNPFSHEVNIVMGGHHEDITNVLVRDINGRILLSYHIAGDAHLTLGSELPAAVYIVEVSNQFGVKNYKVIKQ